MIVDASSGLTRRAAGTMYGVSGRVREGRTLPYELWTWSQRRHPGAADLIASRIPPGHIDWVVGGRVVFFVLIVFLFFLFS